MISFVIKVAFVVKETLIPLSVHFLTKGIKSLHISGSPPAIEIYLTPNSDKSSIKFIFSSSVSSFLFFDPDLVKQCLHLKLHW